MDGFVVIVHGRDFLDVLQDFVEEVAEVHQVDSRDADGVAQAEALKFVDIHFLFDAVDLVDDQDDRLAA